MEIRAGIWYEYGMSSGKYVHIPDNAYLILNAQVFPLDEPHVAIGRGLENELVIKSPGVSRVHARLIAADGHYTLYDEGSTNGTFVNGEQVKRKRLSSGDTIRMSDVTLLYVEMSDKQIDKSRDQTRVPISDS